MLADALLSAIPLLLDRGTMLARSVMAVVRTVGRSVLTAVYRPLCASLGQQVTPVTCDSAGTPDRPLEASHGRVGGCIALSAGPTGGRLNPPRAGVPQYRCGSSQ